MHIPATSRLTFVFIFLLSLHSSIAQNIIDNTFGKGITFQARDSSFYTKFGFRFQTLYTGEQQIGTTEWEERLMIRRMRLKWDGYVLNPKVVYKLELGLSNRDTQGGTVPESGRTASIILDAAIKWNFAEGWYFWAGQTKLPGNRERVISSQNLQFVDRSLVNSRFNLDRDIGIQLHHKSRVNKVIFKQALAISTGEGRGIIVSNPLAGRQYTGRVEVLPFGDFTSKGDYFGSDLMRENSPKLSIGVTGDYNSHAVRARGNLGSFITDSTDSYLSSDLITYFIDGIFKYQGISIMSEYAYRDSNDRVSGFGYGNGFMGAIGYLFKNNFELATRYTRITPISEVSSISSREEYTLGISRYVKGHNFKIQSDASYFTDDADEFFMFRIQCELAL